jgi:hypothetical protein
VLASAFGRAVNKETERQINPVAKLVNVSGADVLRILRER